MKDSFSGGFHEMAEDDPLTADKKPETPRANGCDATPSTLTGRVDYADRLLNAAIGADINDAQSRRILSMLNRAMHPDKEVEPIVLGETLGSIAWDERTWTEKKEIVQYIRPRIRSALSLLNREIDQTKGDIPPWVHSDFHVEWYRIQISGGWPNLIRPGHICRVVDVRPSRGAKRGASSRAIPLTLPEWQARKFQPRDMLMGAWLTTTSRVLISADTGLGKSSLVLAILIGIAAGRNFLHWKCSRPARVLFIDGEMSGEWLQVMAQDAARRLGQSPDNLCLLNCEDHPGMPPLNTKEGYAWLQGYIAAEGPFDFIAFDNIMSLSVGNPKDPEAWQAMLDLIAYLGRSRIGQLWVNHTGHDASRGYGDKAKEWRMTSNIHLDAKERPDTDVSFELKFVKSRERAPHNRDDFQTVRIALVNDRWVHNATEQRQVAPKENSPDDNALRLLKELHASDRAVETTDDWRVVPTVEWREACKERGYFSGTTGETANARFYRAKDRLVNSHNVGHKGDFVWPL